jgi:protein-S-isoprenylcysteine O-methyltransferase Ste14
MASRILPLVGITLFFGVGIVWRAWLQYRRHGHTGITLFRSSSWVQWVGEGGFCLILLAIVAQPVVFAVSPESLSWAQIIAPAPWVVWVGTLVLVVGVIFMVAAQLGMGASWRVGIDEEAAPGLVTSGLYCFCRNPIYLGMFVVAGVRYQVSQEEDYLLRTYGKGFRTYASRVGRFLPGLGKMA